MSFSTNLKAELKEAMIAKDAVRVGVIRNISATIMNEAIAKGKADLEDNDALSVVKRLVKQRKDSIEQFEKGGRADLAATEKAELVILEKYLPQTMSRDEIRKIAEAKKAELGAIDKTKLGQFIGAVMKACAGKADGSDVKAVVEEMVK